MSEAKPFCISKKEVWEAYKRVKANKGAAGVDDQSIEDFEKKLKKNLYKIWNRMSSGSYFPPPVRTVKITKKNGGSEASNGQNYLLCKGRDDSALRRASFPWYQPPVLLLHRRFQPAFDIENDPLFRCMFPHCPKQ